MNTTKILEELEKYKIHTVLSITLGVLLFSIVQSFGYDEYYDLGCFDYKYKYKIGNDGSFKYKYNYDFECETETDDKNEYSKNDKYGRDGFSYPEVTDKLSKKEYNKLVKFCAEHLFDMEDKPKKCTHIEGINPVLSQKVRAEALKEVDED